MDPYKINPHDDGKATPYPDLAKNLVVEVHNNREIEMHGFPETELTLDDVFVVWFAKTLGNWKALVSSTAPNGLYYEVTHNGAKNETYVDIYQKVHNVIVVH